MLHFLAELTFKKLESQVVICFIQVGRQCLSGGGRKWKRKFFKTISSSPNTIGIFLYLEVCMVQPHHIVPYRVATVNSSSQLVKPGVAPLNASKFIKSYFFFVAFHPGFRWLRDQAAAGSLLLSMRIQTSKRWRSDQAIALTRKDFTISTTTCTSCPIPREHLASNRSARRIGRCASRRI